MHIYAHTEDVSKNLTKVNLTEFDKKKGTPKYNYEQINLKRKLNLQISFQIILDVLFMITCMPYLSI